MVYGPDCPALSRARTPVRLYGPPSRTKLTRVVMQELENRVRDQLRQLDESAAERATLQAVVRQRDGQIQSMTDEVAHANAQEAAMAQSLASANTLLKVRASFPFMCRYQMPTSSVNSQIYNRHCQDFSLAA